MPIPTGPQIYTRRIADFARMLETPGLRFPNVFSGEIILAEPAFGTARYGEMLGISLVGAANDTVIEADTVGQKDVWYIPWADLQTSDATARTYALQVQNTRLGGLTVTLATRTAADLLSSSQPPLFLERPIYLPPDHRLVANAVGGLSAGAFMTLRAGVIVLPIGEVIAVP